MTYTILLIGGDEAERSALCSVIRNKLSHNTIETDFIPGNNDYLLPYYNENPDIILMDISNIKYFQDKVSSIKMIRPSIPIIVLTRYADYKSAMAAINSGAQDFLTKPVAIERMNITFRNALAISSINSTYVRNSDIMTFSLLNEDGNIRRIHELEKEAIHRAIKHYDGRMTEVARRLGIGRSTLYRKLNEVRIAEPAV